MLSPNADLHLIRMVLKQLDHLVDAIEAVRLHNDSQDNQLSNHEERISALEAVLRHLGCQTENSKNREPFGFS